MVNCPCCSDQLLRHIRSKELYWFCRSCWQEMPVMELRNYNLSLTSMLTTMKPAQATTLENKETGDGVRFNPKTLAASKLGCVVINR